MARPQALTDFVRGRRPVADASGLAIAQALGNQLSDVVPRFGQEVRRKGGFFPWAQALVERSLQKTKVFALLEEPKPFADHLAGGPVAARVHLGADEVLLAGRNRDIHCLTVCHTQVSRSGPPVSIFATEYPERPGGEPAVASPLSFPFRTPWTRPVCAGTVILAAPRCTDGPARALFHKLCDDSPGPEHQPASEPMTRPDKLPTSPLPEFARPPVAEVACSLQFEPLRQLDGPRLGLLWDRFKGRYPKAKQYAPLPNVVETFTRQAPPQFRVELLQDLPFPRFWFLSEDESRLVQVQDDRFVVNWRKQGSDGQYPRYATLRTALTEDIATFESWLASEGLGQLKHDQVEVTYVNHIVVGSDTAAGSQPLSSYLRLWAGEPADATYSNGPDHEEFRTSYVMRGPTEQPIGRLHVQLQSQLRRIDLAPLYSLTLVGRGAPSAATTEAAIALMDHQHDWIVRTFADVTTDTMHREWGRTQ